MRPFDEVVAEHGAVVLRVCRAMLPAAEADDAWSETFLSAMRAYPDLRPDSNVRGWLTTIAHRKAIDQIRGRNRRPSPVDPLPIDGVPQGSVRPAPTSVLAALDRAGVVAELQGRSTCSHRSSEAPSSTTTSPNCPTPGRRTARHERGGREAKRSGRHCPAANDDERNPTMNTETPGTTDQQLLAELERSIPTPTADDLDTLRAGLAADAEREGVLDVAYRSMDSPYGSLLLAATEKGLVRIGLATEDHDAILDGLAETVSPRMLRSGRRTDPIVRQLDEYFSGDRRRFDVELDLHLVRGFRHDVLTHLVDVGYGTTVSYAVLAAASGNPRAVRAAGSACSHNPIPLVVPCHRVVRSDGSVGNYAGGSEMKVSLLAMESGSADLATTRH
ncbi:MAG: methylated-DNA--[protein]-cysteine S-methyltransferase [Ilumatobacteraceae bacterium]